MIYNQYSFWGANTYETDLIIHVVISYFLTHIVFVLSNKKWGSELAHHIICLAALLYSVITQSFGQDMVLTIFLGELTFVMCVTILAKRFQKHQLEHVSDNLFVFILVSVRVVVFPIYLVLFITDANAQLIPSILAIGYTLNGFNFTQNVLNRRKEKKQQLAIASSQKNIFFNERIHG